MSNTAEPKPLPISYCIVSSIIALLSISFLIYLSVSYHNTNKILKSKEYKNIMDTKIAPEYAKLSKKREVRLVGIVVFSVISLIAVLFAVSFTIGCIKN